MNEELYIPLIQQRLNQSISPEDEKILTEWLNQAEDNQQFYNIIKSAWENSDDYGSDITVDVEQDWHALDQKIKKSGRSKLNIWIAAASLTLIAALFFLLPKKQQTDLIATADNQKITLEDGSTITLKKGSSLSYDDTYKNNRRVKVAGSAHLDVVHNPSSPFIVNGPDISVTVLGTNFLFIDNQDDDIAEVQLIKGKVEVASAASKENITLTTGQRYTMSQGRAEVSNQLNLKLQNWYAVNLDFKNQQLSHVVSQLSNYHGTSISLDQTIKNCKFNGDLKDIPLSISLKNIATIYSCQLIEKNGTYRLLEGKCE